MPLSNAINYHYNKFPPVLGSVDPYVVPLLEATNALARYDQMLINLPNSEILLAPLQKREAVLSSRIEGTIATIEDLFRYEADDEGASSDKPYSEDIIEVALYAKAMKKARDAIKGGAPFSSHFIRSIHAELLSVGRGAHKSPGAFKAEQNYLKDGSKIAFTPISPQHLQEGLDKLFSFLADGSVIPLIKVALAHLEFEALHPFKDGNGRIGRMLIPLTLWKEGVVSQPYFYISAYLEEHKEEYIQCMREVSSNNDWNSWLRFFLKGIKEQALDNLHKAQSIMALYEDMKTRFRVALHSERVIDVLDVVFAKPIFKSNTFAQNFPPGHGHRFRNRLLSEGLIKERTAPSGRKPGVYEFTPLLELVKE